MNKFLLLSFLVFIAYTSFSLEKSVNVKLQYENIITEIKYDSSGNVIDKKIIKKGENPLTLQIIELTKLKLAEDGYITDPNGGFNFTVEILPTYSTINIPSSEPLYGVVYGLRYDDNYTGSILLKSYDKNYKLINYEVITGAKTPSRFPGYMSKKIAEHIVANCK